MAGNVYTVNYGSNNVSKITSDGTSAILGTTGGDPYAIALDVAGNVYTANSYSNNVSKITSGGTSTILGTTGSTPYGIALDVAGNVYTANSDSNNVSKITPNGTSTILGTTGIYPYGIALDVAGNVYTANYGSNNVSKITSDGTSAILGTTGGAPYGIALDVAGNVYTVNYDSNNVSKITSDGTSTIFGTTGSGPDAIALDVAGNVYTANSDSNNVSKITSDGTSTIFGTTGSGPYGIALDVAGNVYTANYGSNNVSKITPTSTASYLADGDTSPITIIGLTNDTEYLMSLIAVNEAGEESAASNSVSVIPEAATAPDAPQITNIEPGNAEVSISVSVADDGGSPITGYNATCTDGTTEYLGISSTSPITVSGLTNGVSYVCVVSATSDEGASPNSELSTATPVGPPSAPQITNIEPGNAEVSISVSVADDGGSPITGYNATCTDGTTEYLGISSTSPITVSGLTNGVSYVCVVSATSDEGASPNSELSTATPVGPPSAPQITSIEPGNAQVSISVSVADDGGSPITGYNAYCFGDTLSFDTSSTLPITVSGLTNGEAYECLVTATNDVRTSPLSGISAPVTPVAPSPGC